MTTHVVEIEDDGDLVDVVYCCSSGCGARSAAALGEPNPLASPAPCYPDYDVYCFGCGVLMSRREIPECDDMDCLYGCTVVNRVDLEAEERCHNGHLLKVRAEVLNENEENR